MFCLYDVDAFDDGVLSHTIHVWYIYLHVVDLYDKLVGKYTKTMDGI